MTSMTAIESLFTSLHGAIDTDKLTRTEVPFIYRLPHEYAMTGRFAYWDGWHFSRLHQFTEDDSFLEQAKRGLDGAEPDKTCTDFTNIAEQIRRCRWFAFDISALAEKGEWSKAFNLVDKQVLFPTYFREFEHIPLEQRWDIFVQVYMRSETGFELLKGRYEKIFEVAPYSAERNKRLKNFWRPDKEIKIYHGESFGRPVYDIFSWTRSLKVAKFFAYRFDQPGRVLRTYIRTGQIVDYLMERGEKEVLFDPLKWQQPLEVVEVNKKWFDPRKGSDIIFYD